MTLYWNTDRQFCRLTYIPEGQTEPVTVWAEVGNIVNDTAQWFLEVKEETTSRIMDDGDLNQIIIQIGEGGDEYTTEPAKYNLATKKLEVYHEDTNHHQ